MTMNKMAVYLGYFFLLLGIMGFIPGLTTAGGYLLGIFHVNAFHNIIHLVTGAAFLWAGKKSECKSLRTFQVFAVIYGLVTLFGLLFINQSFLGPMAHNPADALFHLAVTGVTFYYGYLSGMRRTIHCPA